MNKKMFVIILLLVLIPIIVGATVTTRSNVLFKLKTYNTFLEFETETNFNKIIVESDKIQFDSYWFKLQRANITFKKFFENYNLTFDLEGSTGSTSEIDIYSPFEPLKLKIDGIDQEEGTTWSYNSATNIMTITYTF